MTLNEANQRKLHSGIKAVCFLASLTFFLGEMLFSDSLLPRFGGSAHVWILSSMFYSCTLLLSNLMVLRFRGLHPRLFLITLFCILFLGVLGTFKTATPLNSESPYWGVLWQLLQSCFLPLLALSLTTPCLQQLLERNSLRPERALYAWGGLGSILGVVSYPLLIDIYFSHSEKLWIFRGLGFFTLMGLGTLSFILLKNLLSVPLENYRNAVATNSVADSQHETPWKLSFKFSWASLSFLSCFLMLVVTNYVTHGLGPIPLLWMVPLIIFLASFWPTFKDGNEKFMAVVLKWGPVIWFFIHMVSLLFQGKIWFATHISYYLFLLIALLSIHQQLYLQRPQQGMDSFYLAINLGGTLAATFSALAIPQIPFQIGNTYFDFLLGVVLYGMFLYWKSKGRPWGLVLVFLLVIGYFVIEMKSDLDGRRNFYGVVRIIERNGEVQMVHGNTNHGARKIDSKLAHFPLHYYHPKAPVADVFNLRPEIKEVAMVGMGPGSLLYYAQPNSHWTFYDINPDVELLAKKHLHFLSRQDVTFDVLIIDGRLGLAKNSRALDLLIIDAFNSDSIPYHLMTKEALELYFNQLKSNAGLLMHISSSYYDLITVLAPLARELNLSIAVGARSLEDELGNTASIWAYLAKEDTIPKQLIQQKNWSLPPQEYFNFEVWTDQKKNLLLPLYKRLTK